MDPITVSITNASASLGICKSSVYTLINEGRLATVKIGRRRLVKADSIRALVSQAA
jgi:excisionase family DNA binding protein